MKIGRFYHVRAEERMPQGVYVETDHGDRILLPNSKVPEDLEIGDELDVFVYLDSEDRLIATTEQPLVEANHFAVLEVKDVNRVGAFLDWGLDKDLFLPYKQQLGGELRPGDKCVIFALEDERSGRLVATEKLRNFLETDISDLRVGQKVSLAVYEMDDNWADCLINLRSGGRLFIHPGEERLYIGDIIDGYIEEIRDDGKITLSRFPVGYNSVRTHDNGILQELKENGGFLPYGDHTAPEEIQAHFGLSKKAFKKLIGGLFRDGKIVIEEAGIRLAPQGNRKPFHGGHKPFHNDNKPFRGEKPRRFDSERHYSGDRHFGDRHFGDKPNGERKSFSRNSFSGKPRGFGGKPHSGFGGRGK